MVTMEGNTIKHVHSDLIQSAEDKRLYRGLELTNGMKVLLVSDSTTDKSSAAMDVHIGSLCDPETLPGLAHFCEHMLFLGTDKYPTENEYDKFLSEHGGSSNASTSLEHTKFYFDVGTEFLHGALDRFAQFFLSPLLTESATEREVNAVNAEHENNVLDDLRRTRLLERVTCQPAHEYAKFTTGNKETLLTTPQQEGIDTRGELLKFHNTYYSSNIMSLAVLGKETLDELENMVLPLFHAIKNKSVTIPEWTQNPLGPEQLKVQYHVVPIKDTRKLKVTWPIPDIRLYYKTAPGDYLDHLISHEGKGSLLSELKRKGWATSVFGWVEYGARGFMFFSVCVYPTEEGIENTNSIVAMIFQYLQVLREEGPQKWIFEECRDLLAMHFRFKEKSGPISYTCSLASAMHVYPMNEVLCGGYDIDEYKPELIAMVLEKLTPEEMRIMVVGKKFEGLTDTVEKWYGTQYSVSPIPQDTINAWRDATLNSCLHLPTKNEFIPTHFELVKREEDANEFPQIIYSDEKSRLWFKQDNQFLLPKAYISINITSQYAYMDPLSSNLCDMFADLVDDAMTEYAHNAAQAGLGYSIYSSVYGLSLEFRGFTDKQQILVEKVINQLATLKIDRQRFNIFKENMIRGFNNFKANEPCRQARYYTSVLLSEQSWGKEELLEATEEMTVERLESFIPQLLSKLFLEVLVYGNVTKQYAKEILETAENILIEHVNTKPLPESQQRRFREHRLPDGCSYVYRRTNEVHKSAGVDVYYQCSVQETTTNMMLELFTQLIQEPCFDILRTQEQLGYTASSSIRRSRGVQGLRLLVQSDKHPHYIESRIEAFLLQMEKHMKEMDAVTFNKHIESLATNILEKPKRMSSQYNQYLDEIENYQRNFDRANIEVAYLRELTKEDVLKFYEDFIAHNAPRRRKMCVHIYPEDMPTNHSIVTEPERTENILDGQAGVPPYKKAVPVMDVNLFKRELSLFPLPQPFVPLAEQMSKLDI